MAFFCWMAHPTRRRPVASAFIAAMLGIGIYYESTATAMAGQFVNQAQGGVNFGNSLLLGGQEDAASGAGQQEMQGFAGSNPTPGESGASSYYLPDNVGLTQGNAINQADSANAALMSDPTCPNGWPGPLNSFDSTGIGAVTHAQTVCQTALNAESASIEDAESSGSNAAYTDALENIHHFGTSLADVHSAGNALLTTCAPDIHNQYQYAPACNLLSRSGVPTLNSLGDTWAGTLDSVADECSDLPTSITSPAAAESLSDSLNGLTSKADSLIGQTTGTAEVGDNGSIALSSNYANTTTASQQYQEIYGQCNDAQSYLENISTYPGGLNSYTSDPMLNKFLANPSNQGMINKMMPFIESNPSVFSQYYQNVACTNNNLDIANSGTSSTSVSTTSTSAPSIQSNPVACDEPLSTYTSTGWIDAADWPDPNAEWIYGTTGGCGAGVPNGQTDMMEGTYSNTTGATIDATLYLAANDKGVVDINGTQVASYDDQGVTGAQTYPSTGGVVSVPVTLAPGPDEILYYITNDQAGTTADNTSGGILTIIGTVNGTRQVLIDTNSHWLYTPTNGSSSSGTVTINPGQTVTGTNPNTHAQSILCNSPIKCMGTQCHALFGNQDLHFSEAMTALSALQQMEQNMQCADGTSIKAGNCKPIIFQGKADYCRTWPFGGVFTNNCCKEGLQAGASGPGLMQYLELTRNVWSVANNSTMDSWIFGSKAISPDGFLFGKGSWYETAYSKFDTWASDGWSYVTGAFKGASEAVENAFGVGGASAGAQLGGDVAKVAHDAANASGAASKGLLSGLQDQVEGWLKTAASYVLKHLFGTAIKNKIMQFVTSKFITGLVGDLMLAYSVFQIIQMITEIMTSCKKEEFELGESRKLHKCQNIGTYCTEKFLGFCLEHKDIFCCYASPLDRIIASQIKIGQPSVAGGYGTPKNPNCNGFTPQQLGDVDWNEVSLSAWTAMLQKAGIVAGSNAAGAAEYTPGQIDHPNGDVNADLAPQPIEE
ncbi:conjugal transfer protein TraN [Acidithiobacillus sp. HP-6]|uniref:conjugal transfer protein TraN n=1 Tax=unclassified Acidithiobacillus TaxID=2614800 RepID=UPI00187A4BCC|nr:MULTISPECIES: conjugal transfer protein TraN [unclassified Acidithiobacillus]MBE7562189.1 conjugal transfer protein TraN [Acidithiobacillus sp. HP-6]MBE7568914.1 conjugal transfer protein TraN [Acidithiobacillus sp. HP-2]